MFPDEREYPATDAMQWGLPTLHISTYGYGNPFEDRTIWVNSIFNLYSNDNEKEWSFQNVLGAVRGRGASSWHEGIAVDKRPLRLRFHTARSLLNSGHAATDWVLISNHFDYSLMRNYSAYHLGNQLNGLNWTPFATSIHLYMNGEYMGVYLLADERASTGAGRLELTVSDSPEYTDYLIQLRPNLLYQLIEDVDFIRVNSSEFGPRGRKNDAYERVDLDRDLLYTVHFPNRNMMSPLHVEYVRDYLTLIGLAARSRDFETMSSLVCVNSLVDSYLIHELYRDGDFGFGSTFLHIKGRGDNRRLYMGPIWDFDHTAAATGLSSYGSIVVRQQHYWFSNLLGISEFFEIASARWNTYMFDAINQTISHVDYTTYTYQNDFERNFERHQILGTPPLSFMDDDNPIVNILSYMEQVEFLTEFLNNRTDWLNNHFNHTQSAFEENRTIVLSINNVEEANLPQSILRILHNLGLDLMQHQDSAEHYLAIIKNGEVELEVLSVEESKHQWIEGSLSFSATSSSLIEIDGLEVTTNSSGLNVLIFDNATEMIVDSLNFCSTNGFAPTRNHFTPNSARLTLFLRLLNNENYISIITISNDTSRNFCNNSLDTFESIGLRRNLIEMQNRPYVAILAGSELIFEDVGNPIYYEDEQFYDAVETTLVIDGMLFQVLSQGNNETIRSSILIDSLEKSMNHHSMNIVVVDRSTGEVIDSVRFNLDYNKEFDRN